MADINHVVTLGIGTPGDIEHFILLGLNGATSVTPQWVLMSRMRAINPEYMARSPGYRGRNVEYDDHNIEYSGKGVDYRAR